MPLPYSEFATWTLSDKAVRQAKKDRNRIIFVGNHISRQYEVPIRAANEIEEQFEVRLSSFWRNLPRHDDFSLRLAVATESFIRAGQSPWEAACSVHDVLQTIPALTASYRAESRRLGIPYSRIRLPIGATSRGRRRKRKKRGFSVSYRQVETIRAQVSRFNRRYPGVARQEFESSFSSYRFQFARDVDWFAEVEPVYRQRMAAAQADLGAFHEQTAVNTVALARLLHEQGKFTEAEEIYQLAFERWKSGQSIPEQRRQPVLASILTDIENCRRALPLGPAPVIRAG
jgi:hypothetical protein